MPRRISSIDNKKAVRCRDNHRNDQAGNLRKSKVYHGVIKFMSMGQREFTYAELADWVGLDVGTVKYYFKKLVLAGAITLEADHVQK